MVRIKPLKKEVITITAGRGFRDYQQFIKKIDDMTKANKKHAANIGKILRFLALHKVATTWEIGQGSFTTKASPADTMARRILNGRTDKGKDSQGLVEMGLVSTGKKKETIGSSNEYKLTLYGLLYTIKNYSFTDEALYIVARNHSEMIPYLFDKVDYLVKNHVSLKPLKIIAEGDTMKLERTMNFNTPYFEMFHFISMEYPVKFSYTESHFTALIALWFYTYLMWDLVEDKQESLESWKRIISNEPDIRLFYGSVIDRALKFYITRNQRNEEILGVISNELFPSESK